MSIHVYYLNPDFSCKQLLAAIILSIGYSIVATATNFLCFPTVFGTENATQIYFSFTMGNTEKFFIYEKRFGDKQLARSIYEFRPVKHAYYFLM